MPGPSDPANQMMASVFGRIMKETLRFIREELGGFDMYLDSIGFGSAERLQLRKLLVDPDETPSKL
eukprot:CAMPEP_0180825288 /NCGR_PEP_ID=MMETSP1038_2-20121128/72888_1 /TAXON_ID=632150 /ORGANISM="Azadinium spinosum, Strain 3D9" /LENGTH=65 /DNA_ID=CAMNT_0022867735 /DNA_START=26 /DNA_END=223 /DNA_ORIENTATION=+